MNDIIPQIIGWVAGLAMLVFLALTVLRFFGFEPWKKSKPPEPPVIG